MVVDCVFCARAAHPFCGAAHIVLISRFASLESDANIVLISRESILLDPVFDPCRELGGSRLLVGS